MKVSMTVPVPPSSSPIPLDLLLVLLIRLLVANSLISLLCFPRLPRYSSSERFPIWGQLNDHLSSFKKKKKMASS